MDNRQIKHHMREKKTQAASSQLANAQPLDPKLPSTNNRTPIELIKRVPRAACARTPQRPIRMLQLLQLPVERGGLGRESDEGGVLRLEGGGYG
ncbi:hypothetical protein A7U60_g2738 [Sanghuangporus baumii]|uniref:Uncharacterized protein n=1 Tax=Sanghuangporus baumii TaxID=108892 RepID=A0A9Q5I208_SANBA|nr:hypothetical protein A7U60_g2738 [Sanghuangporus baumii]